MRLLRKFLAWIRLFLWDVMGAPSDLDDEAIVFWPMVSKE